MEPKVATTWEALLGAIAPSIPIYGLLIVLPALYFFFRKTWRELDEDAQRLRGETLAAGKMDLRPFVAMPLCALILTLQEYQGGRTYFDSVVHPLLLNFDLKHGHVLRTVKYEELYGFAWWAGSRIGGYVFAPFVIWKAAFPRDSLLDLGLRVKGFFKHMWIYALFLAIVLPAMWIVSREPDFGAYYPFYKTASRSWADFLMWEAMYFAQFFALEIYFRGFWLGVLRRSMGSGAIFAMAVPYCMIHYGKPYLEANAAIVAGIALGSLSMRTKSIYQGFLVHITVAGLMDWLALKHRNALPKVMWAGNVDTTNAGQFLFPETVRGAKWSVAVWSAIIGIAFLVMLFRIWSSGRSFRGVWARWAKANGWQFSGKSSALVEEVTEDGVVVGVAVDGTRTVVRALGLQAALVRFRIQTRGSKAQSLEGWDKLLIDAEMDTHFDVAAASVDEAHNAMLMIRGDARPELLRLAGTGREITCDYDRGKIAVSWSGEEPDGGMIDVARAITLAFARFRAVG